MRTKPIQIDKHERTTRESTRRNRQTDKQILHAIANAAHRLLVVFLVIILLKRCVAD